jgi:ABC-type polysaccharide/polyol phosphate export permease
VIFRAAPPPFGNSNPGFFPVWLFCGLVPWSFFLIAINTAIPTLLANGPTLQKVYFPSYAPVLGSVAGILVQTLIECAILGVALLLFRNVGPTWLLFPIWLCLFVGFVASVAVSLSIMNVYYRDLAHLTNVALQLLFFLTPIIYQAESVPESWHGIPLRAIVLLNPLAVFVETFRGLAYDLRTPSLGSWLALAAWASAAVVVAMVVYRYRGLDIGEAI